MTTTTCTALPETVSLPTNWLRMIRDLRFSNFEQKIQSVLNSNDGGRIKTHFAREQYAELLNKMLWASIHPDMAWLTQERFNEIVTDKENKIYSYPKITFIPIQAWLSGLSKNPLTGKPVEQLDYDLIGVVSQRYLPIVWLDQDRDLKGSGCLLWTRKEGSEWRSVSLTIGHNNTMSVQTKRCKTELGAHFDAMEIRIEDLDFALRHCSGNEAKTIQSLLNILKWRLDHKIPLRLNF